MSSSEEQQIIDGLAGIAQSVAALLTLLQDMQLQRQKADQEILEVLKLISRKH
jgi:hypothetical protein